MGYGTENPSEIFQNIKEDLEAKNSDQVRYCVEFLENNNF